MTARTNNGKNKQRRRTDNSRGKYGDSGCARMMTCGGCARMTTCGGDAADGRCDEDFADGEGDNQEVILSLQAKN
jgi:hypothetical protein